MTASTFQSVDLGDGFQIAYVASGSGEPLVFLHGGESHRGQFDIFRPLLGPGIQAISYDQRDTGDTVNGEESYDTVKLAEDCAGFITALDLDRAHIFGGSFGGMIAMQVAIRHPERVQSLVLSGTTPSRAMIDSIAHEVVAMESAARAKFMLDMVLTPEGQANDADLVASTKEVMRARPPAADMRRTEAINGHDCVARLCEISAPTLVLHGDEDPLIRPHVAEFMAKQIPGAHLEILERTRHGITFEAREEAAHLVREFVLAHRGSAER